MRRARIRLPPTDAPQLTARRLERARSLLLIVDIQAQLAPHVADADALVARTQGLLSAARLFDIPVVATEHCADRIGRLVPSLASEVREEETFGKTCFSAGDHPEFLARIARTSRTQLVVAGMEAHVCVMQSALSLAASGYEVFAVADAIGSRASRQLDRAHALERLRSAGCVLCGTETVLFEWTHAGDDAAFRSVLGLVKGLP
jgi:nicotinamidase-related amidase